MSKYPEHEKLSKIKDESQQIGEFLEWLQGRYAICTYNPVSLRGYPNVEVYENKEAQHPLHVPVRIDIRKELAAYFDIDQQRLEAEKDQMYRELQVLR